MQRKFLCLLAGLAGLLIFIQACTKIDTTQLGEDLIPAVDNVKTFADTLTVTAARLEDTTKIRISRTETHVLGSINNDPVFGKTKADIFLQLKPSFFPFYFGNANDKIDRSLDDSTHFDSLFICLAYTGFYGDSLKPQHFKVYKLDDNTSNFVDTLAHPLNFEPDMPYQNQANLLGEATVLETDLKNYVYANTSLKDSFVRQVRIKLDTNSSFFKDITHADSTTDGVNNFFRSDSLFKQKFKGFAVVADGGSTANGLFYVSLTDAATRLEVYYRARNATKLDTAFASFPLSTGATLSASATANHLVRDTNQAEYATAPDPAALYIQSAPGTAISLQIDSLTNYGNRIVHRAEIFLEQAPESVGDKVLTAPTYLYLDLIDDTGKRYKPIYYDLSPSEFYNPDITTATTGFFPTDVDNTYFGGYLRSITDTRGTRSYYTFNITRYVQEIATKHTTNYHMRVYAPYDLNYNGLSLQYKNNLAFGRIKIYNGPDKSYRIRLRIVWSKI